MTSPSDPRRGLDELQPIDSGALMADVRAEVERRRAAREYPPDLDDVPPFGDLGLDDELVASVHRLESLSRIPGVTPVIDEVGAGPSGPDGPVGAAVPAGFEERRAGAALVDRGLVAARAVARRVVGPRLERVVRQGAEYLMASAHHGRVVVARILAAESRVRRLEERVAALEGSGPTAGEGAPADVAGRRPAGARKAPTKGQGPRPGARKAPTKGQGPRPGAGERPPPG